MQVKAGPHASYRELSINQAREPAQIHSPAPQQDMPACGCHALCLLNIAFRSSLGLPHWMLSLTFLHTCPSRLGVAFIQGGSRGNPSISISSLVLLNPWSDVV